MLHIKFQAPEPSSSGEEDFQIYFIFEPKTPPTTGQGHFAPRGLQLNKIGITPQGICFIPNFKHLTQVVLKKKIFE